MFKSNLAALVSAWDFLPRRRPHSKSVHFDVWSQSSTQEQWFDLSGRWRRRHRLSLCDSAAKVRDGAPMLGRTRRFPLSPAPELGKYAQAAPAAARRSSARKKPQSSLNSNSIRLLLCVFVSFRSHLAITGANLWSAPGYSVKMTDSHHPPSTRQTPASPTPLVVWLSLPQVSPVLLAHGCHKFDFLMKNQCFECLPCPPPFKGKTV